jgi:Xaa-Pro aminopeptidase
MLGYLRSDGRKGIRNVIVVAYLVECAHHVAREIVSRFRDPEGGPSQVHLIGFPGCFPNAYAYKVMRRLCTHPNVGGALLVSLGCESFDRANLGRAVRESGRPAGLQIIQETGGTRKTIAEGVAWVERARQSYAFDMKTALRGAFAELKLDKGRVAFDDVGFGLRLGFEGVDVVDGYDPLMYARAVKTPHEIALLERSAKLNEQAIRRTVASWEKGCTWRDLNMAYAMAVTELGGFVHDPGGMVWGHPRGADQAIMLQTGLETHEVEPGTHVLFDCHGTIDLYCWDGGKTWVVDGAPQGVAKNHVKATVAANETLLEAMRPGAKISELQAKARAAYKKAGVADADSVVIFFHGLGLSHMDIEQTRADGGPNGDWALEEGMVVPMHLLIPGAANERMWLEEVAVIGKDGGKPMFSWGPEPLTS